MFNIQTPGQQPAQLTCLIFHQQPQIVQIFSVDIASWTRKIEIGSDGCAGVYNIACLVAWTAVDICAIDRSSKSCGEKNSAKSHDGEQAADLCEKMQWGKAPVLWALDERLSHLLGRARSSGVQCLGVTGTIVEFVQKLFAGSSCSSVSPRSLLVCHLLGE